MMPLTKSPFPEGWGLSSQFIGYEGMKFVCYFWRSGWTHVSLGLHFDWAAPNIEIHVPFGFIRVGRRSDWRVVQKMQQVFEQEMSKL